MKTKVNLRLVTGDPNLVTMDEIYVQLDANGTITALKRRNDAGELVTIVDQHVDLPVLEANKEYPLDLASATTGTIEIFPTEDKDAMEKVTLTITDSSTNTEPPVL